MNEEEVLEAVSAYRERERGNDAAEEKAWGAIIATLKPYGAASNVRGTKIPIETVADLLLGVVSITELAKAIEAGQAAKLDQMVNTSGFAN
jgi:hypothetical protein